MNLERKEFLLICDATTRLIIQAGAPVKDQICNSIHAETDGESLDEKWDLNRANLFKKLDAASEPEFAQLWDDIQKFWERHRAKNNA